MSSFEFKFSGELGRMLFGISGEVFGIVLSVDLMRERAGIKE